MMRYFDCLPQDFFRRISATQQRKADSFQSFGNHFGNWKLPLGNGNNKILILLINW